MRAEDPVEKSTHAVPFRPQKAKVHPAVPKSDTFVDASVIVYPIHIDQGSSNLEERDT